ncbi:MAG: TonB-dependent receptor [Desulfococcaceae bacterium]
MSANRRIMAFLALLGWLTATAGTAMAQSSEQRNEAVELPSVKVVASPIMEGNAVDRYAGQQAVVSREQMEDLNAHDLSSALRSAPGVNITRYNVVGAFGGGEGGAVFIRGLGSSRPGGEIQTLIDGAPTYNGIWNHPLLDLAPVAPAGSVEVFKGPQPSVFGNAFSAINLAPRKQEADGFDTEISAAYGSFSTFMQEAVHGGRFDRFDYLIGQSFHTSDGDRDDAEGETQSYFLNAGYRFSDAWSARFFLLRTDNWADDPGPDFAPTVIDDRYETNSWLSVLTLSHDLGAAQGDLKFYWNTGEGDWLDQNENPADDTLNDFDLYGVRARETLTPWENGEVRAGFDLDYISGDVFFGTTETTFEPETLSIFSPFAAVSHGFDLGPVRLTPSAGLRHYVHGDMPDEAAPHAGLVAEIRDTRIHAGYSRGVVYPGLNVLVFSENFWARIPGNDPNAWRDLDPETVDHFELGIAQAFGNRLLLDVTGFYDDGRDRYVIVQPPPPPPRFESIDSFTIRGVEATATLFPTEGLSVYAGVTYLDTDPGDLPYAPEWTVSGGVNLRFLDHFRLSADAQYVDEMHAASQSRVAGAGNPDKVGDHFLVNAKLSYDFQMEQIGGELYLAGRNLTDADYAYTPGYPMPGASVMAGARVRF